MLQAYRIYNTWMGEPSKLIILRSILEEIRKENLLQLVQATGSVLLSGLQQLEVWALTVPSVARILPLEIH